MNTRFGLGISALVVAAGVALPASAQGAVTVVGGGLGQACYEAVEYGQGSATRAIDLCTKALEVETLKRRDRAATYTNRGILFMRQGNNTRAMWDYQRGLDLMPDLQETKINLGAALYNLKRYPEAMTALNEGIVTDDTDAKAVAHYNRGLTHEKLGDLQSAYEDFREALYLDPDFELAAQQMQRFTVVPAGS
ncbi:MAG: tetratricopeptide repeat protein [Hyphomonadaceae bacterium]